MIPKGLATAAVLLVAITVGVDQCAAQERQDIIKIALLKHLGDPRLIEWPNGHEIANHEGKFVVGIYGVDLFGRNLRTRLETQTTGNRNIEILDPFSDIDDYQDCHLLYLPRGADFDERLRRAVAALAGKNVLIVGDKEGAARNGAAISLYVSNGNRVRIEANRASASKDHGITIKPALLNRDEVRTVSNR